MPASFLLLCGKLDDMKKISLVLLGISSFLAGGAQTKPVFGLKAGVNISNWHVVGGNSNALDNLVGFHVGALGHFHLSDQIALQPEIQYSTQGAENAGNGDKYTMGYINVPVMLQYMFNNGFRIEAGPYFGLLVNAKDKLNGVNVDSKDDYKSGDVGLGFGLNYLSYSGLGIGGRYNLGLANINETGSKVNNRYAQFSVFYMLDSRHKAKSR